MDAQRVNLDGFAEPDAALGLVAMASPADPAPGLVIDDGRVTGLDGVAEAMTLPDVAFARLMVDPAVPRAEVVRLAAACRDC